MKDILLVDDEPDLLSLFQEILKSMGFSVRPAENGDVALAALSKSLPDLVILDIMMEPMSGWDVLRRMRDDVRTRNVPVIVLTGKVPLPNEVLHYEDLLNGFAMKPLRKIDFEALISGYFAEEKKIAEKCENALKSGLDEALVSEYARLCTNVRVLEDMLGCLYRVMKADSPEGGKEELSGIINLLNLKRARISEIETKM